MVAGFMYGLDVFASDGFGRHCYMLDFCVLK